MYWSSRYMLILSLMDNVLAHKARHQWPQVGSMAPHQVNFLVTGGGTAPVGLMLHLLMIRSVCFMEIAAPPNRQHIAYPWRLTGAVNKTGCTLQKQLLLTCWTRKAAWHSSLVKTKSNTLNTRNKFDSYKWNVTFNVRCLCVILDKWFWFG